MGHYAPVSRVVWVCLVCQQFHLVFQGVAFSLVNQIVIHSSLELEGGREGEEFEWPWLLGIYSTHIAQETCSGMPLLHLLYLS